MATRKIRLTMSGIQVDGVGPIVDVDFNNENQDADLEITAVSGTSTVVKEYTVDVDAGTYNLDIEYKNDIGGDSDRNCVIEKIEYANDGVNYETLIVDSSNTNCVVWENFFPMGWIRKTNPDYDETAPLSPSNSDYLLNPDYNESEARTDAWSWSDAYSVNPGSNPKFQYDYEIKSVTLYGGGTKTFNITFS